MIALKQRGREPNRDRGPVARRALNVERASTHLGAFAHHRHPEVALRAGGPGIEADTIVQEHEDDVVVVLADGDRDLRRAGVFEGVHHAFASDVEDQERDRSRKVDVLDVSMEGDPRIAADLVGERFEGLRQTLRAER
jgi:hypothetical protein